MEKKLVIFGLSEIAELAYFYFQNDSQYEVVAFTLDSEFKSVETKCGLPVVNFEDVDKLYPADKYEIFIALSYTKVNSLRKEKYLEAKSKGYRLASYISSKCTDFSSSIGDNCFILEDNTIQPFVTIGNNVTLWSGNHIGHHSEIASHSFISSHVVISGGVKVEEQCFIGVNATLRDHIIIGKKSVVGAGSTILSDVDPQGVYIVKETERSKVPSSRLRKI
ncbi:acetyltransferase [Vibrio bivalvicida]|uniref:Transferase n=1 Tax=Vibrio bivalvicida TaxID=1276888 RepID=A0A177Y5Y8_9VIBR|nr:acetyltransferase [Vibrio bivalvicida]OAJ96177.1 transferase [Vibrio bivalvicida]